MSVIGIFFFTVIIIIIAAEYVTRGTLTIITGPVD